MADTTVEEIKIVVRTDVGDTLQKLSEITSGFKKLSDTLPSVNNNIDRTTNSLTGMRTAVSRTERFLTRLSGVFADWFKASSDYVESMNLFAVSMGDNADKALDFAKSLQKVGINLKEWVGYQGSFNQLLSGYGIDDEYTENMSRNLTQLAYDISSYANIPVSEAFNKLQSGMSGQIKGLKPLGVNLSIARLRETALANGIELTTAKMTEAQKTTLRYISVMEQTKNMQGDLSRTIITPANSLRILQSQIERAKIAWGNIVSVVLVQVIPAFQSLVGLLEKVGDTIAKWLGYNPDDYLVDPNKIASLGNDASDLSDSLDDATNSAKKLKRQLMGFDEINKLSDVKDIASTMGGGLDSLLGLGNLVNNAGYDFGLNNIDLGGFENTINVLSLLVSGALFAIGVFLLFSGHPALGITLMLMGVAVGVYTLVTNSSQFDFIKKYLVTFGVVSGLAAVAVGLVLTFGFGLWELGIPLIVAGLTVTAVALNTSMTDELKKKLQTAISITGMVACVIGLLLCVFTVYWPLGLALIVLGVTGMVAMVKTDDSLISKKMKKVLTGALVIVGVTAVVLGILLCTAQMWGVGIGLILLGASSLVASVGVNWNIIGDKVKEVLGNRVSKEISNRLLVMGVIIAIGGNLPIGLGMILAGAGLAYGNYKLNNPGGTLISFVTDTVAKIESKLDSLRSKIQQLKDELSVLDVKTTTHTSSSGVVHGGGSSYKFGDITRGILRSIRGYADGGSPDFGEIFLSRERGPELVGRIGRRNAVVNNDQIVTSVESGVEDGSYRGFVRAMQEMGGFNNQNDVYLDGEKITKSVITHHNNMVKATGSTPLTIR